MARTTYYDTVPGFVADHHSLDRNNGRQIAWDSVGESYRSTKKTVKANGAAAAGATSITVDALPVAVLAGTILNFGTYAPVTVTANGAAAAAATSITVDALSGPIPNGTVLDFTGAGEFAVLTAAAVAAATTLTVEALDAGIEDNDTALFPGGTIAARVTANAAAAATTLTVDELQFAVADNAEATIGGTGAKTIPAGTMMAELASGKVIPRAAVTAAETASAILEATANADDKSESHGYGMIVGGVLYQNLLPDFANAAFATWKTELQAAGVGTGWAWQTYADNTA